MKVHIFGVLRCHLVEITRKLGFVLQFQPIANAKEGNEDLAKQLLQQLAVGDLDFVPDVVYGFISQLSALDIIPSTEDDSFIFALVPFASPLPAWSLPLRGRLYNLIVQPDHYPEIDTFEHLASSGIPLFLPNGFGNRDGPRPLGVADVLAHLQLLASCLCAAAVTFCAERWRAHSGAQRFAQMRMRRRGNAPLCEQLWRCKTDAHRPSKFMKLKTSAASYLGDETEPGQPSESTGRRLRDRPSAGRREPSGAAGLGTPTHRQSQEALGVDYFFVGVRESPTHAGNTDQLGPWPLLNPTAGGNGRAREAAARDFRSTQLG
ncbi:Protein of unknown function [Gryllus bimaculatus]|nr:Protein of unknown function [Gryllus bimaculatus]